MARTYPELEGKRVTSLVRASGLKQMKYNADTGLKDDLPVQREINNEFIDNNKMILVREVTESGISASKTPLAERVKLLEIIESAKRKEFDVLVVFKHDRISRRTEEYLTILKELNMAGVRIFTSFTGEEKKTSHLKGGNVPLEAGLLNMVDGMSAERESNNIRERVLSSHCVATRNGTYRGGGYAFGYDASYIGDVSGGGKPIKTLQINEQEADIVRKIFHMALYEGLGVRTIAEYLNDPANGFKEYAREGNGWSYQTIRYMLTNKTYCGYFHFNVKDDRLFLSDKIDSLEIIPEREFNKIPSILTARNKKIQKDKDVNDQLIGLNDRSITKSDALLSGFIRCGHCGSKMSVWSNYKKYMAKDGTVHNYIVYRYKCNSRATGRKDRCDGQTTYSVSKIDSNVEFSAVRKIAELVSKNFSEEFLSSFDETLKKIKSERKNKEAEAVKKQRELSALQSEMGSALLGESVFTKEELKEAILRTKSQHSELMTQINNLIDNEHDIELNKGKISSISSNLQTWVDRYYRATTQHKKELLYGIIDNVEVKRDSITITYIFEVSTLDEFGVVKCDNMHYQTALHPDVQESL